jgi:hypothetical protein
LSDQVVAEVQRSTGVVDMVEGTEFADRIGVCGAEEVIGAEPGVLESFS